MAKQRGAQKIRNLEEAVDFELMVVDDGTPLNKKITKDRLKNLMAMEGSQLKSVKGGTVESPTVLAAPETTLFRWAKASPGVYSFSGWAENKTATIGKEWAIEWNHPNWSLIDMGELPTPDLTGVVTDDDINVNLSRTNQLFNKETYRANTVISNVTGQPSTAANFESTLDIPIPVGQTHINWSGLTTTQHRFTFVKSNGEFVQFLPATTSGYIEIPAGYNDGSSIVNATYKHQSDSATVRNTFMFAFGQTILPYQPYYLNHGVQGIKGDPIASKYVVDVTPVADNQPVSKKWFDDHRNDGALSTSNITTVPIGKNLFNKDPLTFFTGYIDTLDEYTFKFSTIYQTSGYIPVNELSQYFLSGLSNIHHQLGVQFADEDYVKLGGQTISANATSAILKTIANTANILLTFKTAKAGDVTDPNNIQLEIGTESTSYEPYKKASVSLMSNQVYQLPKTYNKEAFLFGDSITETYSITGNLRNNWPSFAIRELMWIQTNFAKSGAGFVHTPTPDYPEQWLSVQIDHAQATGKTPDIVVVSLGTNDLNDTLGSYDTAMGRTIANLDMTITVEAARSNFNRLRTLYPNAKFYYALPIQRASMELTAMLPLINELRKMAERYGFTVIEATYESGIVKDYEVNGAAGLYLYDGLHPNPKGQKKMSDTYVRRILSTYNI